MTLFKDKKQIATWLRTLRSLPRKYNESLPDSNWLQQTISECFWASLQAEEARPVRASIVFAHRGEVTQSIRFAQPFKLERNCIRRLAASFDPDTSVLASDGGEIWGAALTVPRETVLISITGYGRLLVRRGPRIIASFESGSWTSHPDVDDYIQNLFPQLADPDLRSFLLDASVSMKRLGHGGTLIVASDANPGSYLEGGHAVDGFLDTARTWSQYTSAEAQSEAEPTNPELRQQAMLDQEHRKQQRSRLRDVVVRLSAIDGAVVLSHTDTDPCVLRFGAKIIAEQKESGAAKQLERIEFPCNTGCCSGWEDLQNIGGTRHQSAARLAVLRPDVTILVVSQDGYASLIAQIENTGLVRILKGFERALPPESTLKFGSYVNIFGTARGSTTVSGVGRSSKEPNPE